MLTFLSFFMYLFYGLYCKEYRSIWAIFYSVAMIFAPCKRCKPDNADVIQNLSIPAGFVFSLFFHWGQFGLTSVTTDSKVGLVEW